MTRDRPSRSGPAGWRYRTRRIARIGEGKSLRLRILLVAAGAMTPIILIASSLALDEAHEAGRLSTTLAWVSAAALPGLVGAAGVLAISIVMEGWILRWLVYLERLAKAYSRGRYSLRPRMMERAPAEFRGLGDAVAEMAAAVERAFAARGLETYGPARAADRGGVISFNFADIHAHDLASILDLEGVCIRAGHHCAMPLMDKMNWPATARASFYLYTTEADIDALAAALEKAAGVFKIA